MLITTVLGARPQFIKASYLSKIFVEHGIEERIIHTGQHYDENMSSIFFEQLGVPEPAINLEVSGMTHGAMTGKMIEGIEADLLETKPDRVLVYGDTDSTLAGAIAASKLNIPIIHVEAGLRSYDKTMPEEINRVLTDHLSYRLLCPTRDSVSNLEKEGILNNVSLVGDVMQGVLLDLKDTALQTSELASELKETLEGFYLATVHRASNTDDKDNLFNILSALDSLDLPVVMPMHPRTRKVFASTFPDWHLSNVRVIDPVSYFDMLALIECSELVLTDSGGLQKEAVWMQKPCVTLRDTTEWIETIRMGWNVLVGADKGKILEAVSKFRNEEMPEQVYEVQLMTNKELAALISN